MLRIGQQLAHPRGISGHLVGAVMERVNRGPSKALIAALDIGAGDRVLDIGCGDGATLALVPQASILCGLDRSQVMVDRARARLASAIDAGRADIRIGDMRRIPFASHAFDRIIASNVLYFCEDVPALIDECRRVARPGARLGIYVTDETSMRRWRFASTATHRHFSAASLEAELVRSGVERDAFTIQSLTLGGGIAGLIAVVKLI